MRNLERLKEIDCYLFDMDGTIYIEGKIIEGARETIEYLRTIGKKIIFLTNNSSVSAKYYVGKLNGMGISATESEVYTSGNAAEEYLQEKYFGASVYLVGTKELEREFIEKGFILTKENPDVLLLSYDKELNYQKLILATRYINMGKPYIATHPDINCPATPFYEPDIGSFMALIEKSTGRMPDVICGKPYAPIAKGIEKRVALPAEKIAMVGDRLMTDIRFGNLSGFLSVLTLTGESTEEDEQKSEFNADVIVNSVADISDTLRGN